MSKLSARRILIATLVLPLAIMAISERLSPPPAEASAAAVADADAAAKPTLTTGLLRVRMDTTSDWSTVTFSGRLGGLRIHSMTGVGEARRLPNGFLVRGVTSSASVVFDVVLEDASAQVDSWVNTEKGQRGSLRVQVENRTGTPRMALDARNDVWVSLDGRYRRMFTISREQLFGPTNLELPRPNVDPKVLAFYYPWFDDEGYDDPTLADRPVADSDVWEYDDVLAMTKEARAAGIDGFVSSWAGAAANGEATKLMLRAAHATDGVGTVVFETAGANRWNDRNRPPEVQTVETWLRELVLYAQHPSFLRVDGKPVVVVYEMRQLPVQTWREILDRLAAQGAPLHLIGDAGPAWGNASWGSYDYSPWADDQGMRPPELAAADADELVFQTRARSVTHPARGPHLAAATVYPGYDDRNLRGADRPVVERNGTATYDTLWDAAIGADPDWVFITSWNEWWEGTSIQPGRVHGSAALDATAPHVARFEAG